MLKKAFCLCALAFLFSTGIAIAQEEQEGPFTADRHKERGLKCEACHGDPEPKTAASPKSCLTCHKSLEAVADRTNDRERNPHNNHLTQSSDVECTDCHHGHKADTILCHQCHTGMTFEKMKSEEQEK